LAVGFGPRESVFTGSYVQTHDAAGGKMKLYYRFRGEDLADAVSATSDAIVQAPVIPNGSLILGATLEVVEAFAGSSAVLDIGVYDSAGTAVDDDGIDAAIAVTSIDALGDTIACDGADINTIVATSGGVKIAASYDTAAFTAGEALLTVEYVPAPSSS
jgi:hypothetical protein